MIAQGDGLGPRHGGPRDGVDGDRLQATARVTVTAVTTPLPRQAVSGTDVRGGKVESTAMTQISTLVLMRKLRLDGRQILLLLNLARRRRARMLCSCFLKSGHLLVMGKPKRRM